MQFASKWQREMFQLCFTKGSTFLHYVQEPHPSDFAQKHSERFQGGSSQSWELLVRFKAGIQPYYVYHAIAWDFSIVFTPSSSPLVVHLHASCFSSFTSTGKSFRWLWRRDQACEEEALCAGCWDLQIGCGDGGAKGDRSQARSEIMHLEHDALLLKFFAILCSAVLSSRVLGSPR